jgi:PAS domain S-box-containing protein
MAASPQGYTITLLQVFTGILLTTGLVVAALAVELAERRALEQVLNDQAEKLRQSEAQLRDYAEVASDWLWETNDQFRFTRFEGNSRSETARLKTKMLGKTCWEAAGAPTSTAEWQEYIRRHKAHEAFRDFTYSIADDSGQAFHLSSSGRPLFGQQGQFLGYRGVSTDLTEKMRLEAQLRHSQKMEALGQLTGGLAHDFNNLLTVILGNAETIAEMTEDQKLRSLAEMIQSAADRGSDLTQKLLSFGRRQSLLPKPLILREVLSNLEGLLRRALGEHIELEIHAPESQWLVVADQGQLESAILNLVLNARDAMPTGGVLRIETNEVAPALGKDACCLSITVSDTGTGMAPEVMERAFEPFYSTKEVGKGSGLGLSMVYGFAEQSGGHVSISSKVGEGTSITIGLPAQLDARAQSTNDAEDAEPIPDGKERILVVEDDPQVLQFVTAQLLSLGYDVTAVSVGMDALERLEQDGRYDVLFTDVVLPKGMSGVEVARRARDLKPDLKVLLTSGYSEDVFEQHGRPDEGTFLLRKPYRRRELAETLRKVLDQEQA